MTEPDKTLELLNVKVDVWIDEEHYDNVYRSLKLKAKDELAFKVDSVIEAAIRGERVNVEGARDTFQALLETMPSNHLTISDIETGRPFTSKETAGWQPLFLAKRFRARAMENGADSWMTLLDDIVLYLHKSLPILFPRTPMGEILRHLYFQELAACAKPGLESLGYATRALDLLREKRRNPGNGDAFALYQLWGKLNEGIGHWHSNQKMKAALCFNEIIRDFDAVAKGLSDDERPYWSRLILQQALLNRAELQEALQFSFHSLRTLQRLGDGKPEHRLIKEALAYRDMRRLPEAETKMRELFMRDKSQANRPGDLTIKKALTIFNKWGKTAGPGIWTKAAGLVFDYCLEKLEGFDACTSKNLPLDQLSALTDGFIRHRPRLTRSRLEGASYFQQIARYLKWLADTYKKGHSQHVKAEIDKLFAHMSPAIKDIGNPGIDGDIRLREFNPYDYSRFSESMEKFFERYNKETDFLLLDDEISFLRKLNEFERTQSYLYEFRKIERNQRIEVIESFRSNGPPKNCKDIENCFAGPEECQQFAGVMCCSPPLANPLPPTAFSDFLNTGFLPLVAQDYQTIMEAENHRFLDYLKFRSIHEPAESSRGQREKLSDEYRSCHFLGLQRWNSQTPTLTLSLGGGYLLYEQNKKGEVTLGIAIDPGFDFVDNLFHMGFTLQDIDFILITHAHLDHIRDFEPIVSAMLDLTKRDKTQNVKGKIHAIMSLGVYHKLESIIVNTTLREFLADSYIVDIEREIETSGESFLSPFRFAIEKHSGPDKARCDRYVSVIRKTDMEYDLEIIPTKAYHEDYSDRSDSFGYIINRRLNGRRAFSFGYTGDTKWHGSLLEQYSACDILCVHLGALIESEDSESGKDKFEYYEGPQCDELLRKKGHPYLFGLLKFLKEITEKGYQQKLLLLSEFGEELKGGIRIDLVHRINKILAAGGRQCLPVDIGLNVKLADNKDTKNPNQYKVRCFGCDSFVKVEDIRFRHFGYGRRDEGLYYFCSTCLKSKPENIIQSRMREISELGIPLQKTVPNVDG